MKSKKVDLVLFLGLLLVVCLVVVFSMKKGSNLADIEAEATVAFSEVLSDRQCVLPCYLGIIPGETTISQAQDIIFELGGSYVGEYTRKKDNAVYFSYNLNIVAEGESLSAGEIEDQLFQRIDLITENDIVQITEIFVGASASSETYRGIWARFFVSGIFDELGTPEEIFVNTIDPRIKVSGREILIRYTTMEVELKLYGNAIENNICWQFPSEVIHLVLSLSWPGSSIDIYADGRALPTNLEVWIPIEDSLGLAEQEFVDLVKIDPVGCAPPS